ncbi:peptide deformylase [Sodalis-like secondary symbiont of Drepanosiphum platanoidis]|uniref:peptide deformylase n=1 Tax=Sodalis-like secondary symbiont of Drepanosiphum platanoidis TaxID=2994493 RepID=UPI003463961A
MSILNILHYPDKRLRNKSSLVKKIDNNIKKIINNMIHTMHANNGIGLAAPQINIHKQIIIINISKNNKKNLVLINPKIIKKTGNIGIIEGCLSFPGKEIFIYRSKYITVKAINFLGQSFKIKTNGLLSICIQHEIDHLMGILFIDY